jgi:L-lactate dehydrogenase complex protein LldG
VADDAADHAAALATARADGLAVALAVDPSFTDFELHRRLVDAGASPLVPDDPHWIDRLGRSGAGLTAARLAVAATGSIVLVTGPGLPRAASLVPAAHVCLVRVSDIVAEVADAIERFAVGELPSAVIWVGGPSRTSDLEMRPTFGIHGPKSVDVVLVDA